MCVLAACLAALGGCGSHSGGNGIASQGPARALARIEAAARDAATVHVTGSLAGPARPLAVDMELVREQGGKGTIGVGDLGGDLVQDAGWLYVKPNPALLRRMVGAEAAAKLTGRWLKGPADHGPFAPLASLTDLRTVLHETLLGPRGQSSTQAPRQGGRPGITITLSAHPALRIKGVQNVAGRPAVALEDTSTGATLYASATGSPYPLELHKPGRDGGTLTFDRWNQAVTLEAPPNPLNIKSVFTLKGL